MADSPLRFATLGQPSNLAPVPIAATFSIGSGVVTITFDGTLLGGTSASANWFIRRAGRRRTFVPDPSVFGSAVLGPTTISLLNAGPAVVSYLASPPDLFDLFGRPILAFADFPLTDIA